MGEGEAGDEEERACVGWVADVAVETRGDEGVGGVDGEVKGEKVAEGSEAVEADVGATEDCKNADEEEGSHVEGGGGEWAYESGCGEGERRGDGEDSTEVEDDLGHSTEPDNELVYLEEG